MRLIVPIFAVAAVWSSEALARTTLATGTAPDIPWFRIALSFLLCIALAVGAIFALRIYHARGGGGLKTLFATRDGLRSSKIDIVEMRRINPHADLCVVHFAGEELLLSVGRDGTSVLARSPRTVEPVNDLAGEVRP